MNAAFGNCFQTATSSAAMVSQPNLNRYRPGSVTRPTCCQVTLSTTNPVLPLQPDRDIARPGRAYRAKIRSCLTDLHLESIKMQGKRRQRQSQIIQFFDPRVVPMIHNQTLLPFGAGLSNGWWRSYARHPERRRTQRRVRQSARKSESSHPRLPVASARGFVGLPATAEPLPAVLRKAGLPAPGFRLEIQSRRDDDGERSDR